MHRRGQLWASGIHQNAALLMASSGAVDAQARQARNSSPARSTGYITAATGTTGPSGWAVNSNMVTTPKLPPPPRTAQNRSGFSVSLARRSCPSAVTISTERRLSQVSP